MNFKKKIVITKTPLRISFSGGGTDMPYFYNKNCGLTISSAINKYVYITIKTHENFDEKYRLNYSQTEIVNDVNKIKNLRIRETIKYFNINYPLYISTVSDLPYNTGLGSSSSFLVGLINGLFQMLGIRSDFKKVAEVAFYIENKITKNSLGKQDHYIASYGGFKKIDYNKNSIKVKTVNISKINKKILNKNILFFWTGKSRLSKNNLVQQKKNFKKNFINLLALNQLTVNFNKEIQNKKIDLVRVGGIMHEGWKLKKQFTTGISNSFLDRTYETAMKHGCLGGKLLGAGGGGFFLFICYKKNHKKVTSALKVLQSINFNFEKSGSEILVAIYK